jgi:hypothetical protein
MNRTRKLMLNRETVRTLTSQEMVNVVGGFRILIPKTTLCPSASCPAPPLTSPGHCAPDKTVIRA